MSGEETRAHVRVFMFACMWMCKKEKERESVCLRVSGAAGRQGSLRKCTNTHTHTHTHTHTERHEDVGHASAGQTRRRGVQVRVGAASRAAEENGGARRASESESADGERDTRGGRVAVMVDETRAARERRAWSHAAPRRVRARLTLLAGRGGARVMIRAANRAEEVITRAHRPNGGKGARQASYARSGRIGIVIDETREAAQRRAVASRAERDERTRAALQAWRRRAAVVVRGRGWAEIVVTGAE
jgi:hypothetical protein